MPVRAAPTILVGLVLIGVSLVGAEEDARKVPTRLIDCDALIQEEPERLESYRCYWFVGRNHDRLPEAARRLESLLELDRSNPHILLTLGAVTADLGQERAEDLYREALEAYVAAGDARGEIYCHVSLAVNVRQKGLTREASEHLQLALARSVEAGDEALEAQVRVNLGWQKYYEREYGQAWELLTKAERLVFPEGSIYEQLSTLDGLAAVCWALERKSEALEYYRRMIELMQGTDPYRESDIRRNMAYVAKDLAGAGQLDVEEFTRLLREALDAAIRAGNPRAEVGARLMLAASLSGPEGFEQARIALAAARKIGRLSEICWALGLIAEKSQQLDPQHPERAFAAIEEAIDLARSRGDPEVFAKALDIRARMRWYSGPRSRAIEDSFAALDAIERIRDLQPDGEVRARVFARFARAHRDFADALLDDSEGAPGLDDIERALAILERMRARSLLETLDAAGATAALAPSGPLPDARAEVLNEITSLQRELGRAELMAADRRRLRAQLSELEAREASLRMEIADADPDFAVLRGVAVPSLDELKAGLDEDQALIIFLIDEHWRGDEPTAPSRSWAIVVSQERVQPVRLPDCRELRHRVRMYLSLLNRKDGSERSGAERLYRDLLDRPVKVLSGDVSMLVVIPDGPLHRLPFGALIDPASGTFLAEHYAVAIAPSAATWLRWKRSEGNVARSALLTFADPGLPTESVGEDARDSVVREPEAGLVPLPHARREAEMLRRHLGSDSQVLFGADASESALKHAEPGTFRILHFASHAVVDDEHPDRSAVVLAADPSEDGEDGFLRFREVVSLDLDGQLVLLSACRGASGPLIGGEGVMGLANAFFQAGARTVIAGLRPVRDRETSLLVDRLGRHLSAGQSVATALALARRDLVKRGLPPAAWANMVVLGDGDLVPFPSGQALQTTWRPLIVTAVVFVALAILFAALLLRKSSGTPPR